MALRSNQGDRGHAGAKHPLCKLREYIELALGRRVEEGNLGQRILAKCLALIVRHVPPHPHVASPRQNAVMAVRRQGLTTRDVAQRFIDPGGAPNARTPRRR
ncbi:hypothetical protein MexAM1_META1p4166 [Methylorubrum extorquens AM1]|uniref:Uncharacterized protein n=1 Tax=Methylorubrum extorquens (strain ATCC 14718 / DSM 1338 / JCM 2805 / NCIMB 9133 / AM1) TaxID=272630 RepID=C5B1Z6_METEA|nr:hypothetical protein MexAM1_META1p4166 [Methylorubrum extorquens AM1]